MANSWPSHIPTRRRGSIRRSVVYGPARWKRTKDHACRRPWIHRMAIWRCPPGRASGCTNCRPAIACWFASWTFWHPRRPAGEPNIPGMASSIRLPVEWDFPPRPCAPAIACRAVARACSTRDARAIRIRDAPAIPTRAAPAIRIPVAPASAMWGAPATWTTAAAASMTMAAGATAIPAAAAATAIPAAAGATAIEDLPRYGFWRVGRWVLLGGIQLSLGCATQKWICAGANPSPSVSEGLPWLGSKRLCRNPLADARGSDWRIPHRSGSLDWPALVQGLHFQVAHPLSLFDTLGLPGMLDNAPPVIVAAVETTVVPRRWARWSGSAGTPSPQPPSTRLAQH